MKSSQDTSLRVANQRLLELRQRIHGPGSKTTRPESAIKIHQEDELPSNESSSIHSGLREDSELRTKFDVNSRKLKIFKSKPTCLLSTIPTASLTGTPSEKCSDNTLTGSNFDPFAQSRPISMKEREYNSNKSFRTATSQIDSDAEILDRLAAGRIHRDTVGQVDSVQQEPTFGQIIIQRESIKDLVSDGIMAPPPDLNQQMLPLRQNEEHKSSLISRQKSAAKSENKESFFEQQSSSFDLLRGGLDDEALLSLESAGQQNMTPQLQYEQLMTNQKEEQKMMSPDSCSNFNPVQLNESSSFAVTIEGTYEEVKQCLKQSPADQQRFGSEPREAINGMEVISEEREEVDDSSIMAKSKTSRQNFHSSSKKRGSLLQSTIKEVHQVEPSFGTFGKRESDRKARRQHLSPGMLNAPLGTPAQETPELATKQQSSRNEGNNINGSQFMARLDMAGNSAQGGFVPSSTDDLYFSPWSSKKNTHELTFSGSIKRKMMLPQEDAQQMPPDIGSQSFLSTIRGSNNDLSMTDQSRTLRFLKSENQTSGQSPRRPIEEHKHMSETYTRNTIGSNYSNKHLVSNTVVGSNPLTARQDNQSMTSSNDGQLVGNFGLHGKENNGVVQMPSELNEILHQKNRRPSSHFRGSAYSTDGQYTLLSTERQAHSRFNSLKRPESGAISFAMEQQGPSENAGSQQIYSGYFVSPSSKSASHKRSETDALMAQFEKIEKEKFQLERKVIEREVEIERVSQELEDLKVHSSSDFNTLRNKYDSELTDLQKELEEQKEEASYKIGELEEAHQRKLQRIESLHQQQMEQLHQELTSHHQEHVQKLKDRIGQLTREIETERCVQKAKERFEERQVKNETYEFQRQNIFERENLRREFEERLQKEVAASEERLRTEYEYELMQTQKKHQD